MTLNWDSTPILLENHPGPHPGAIWVVMPEEKIVFVGDTVVKNQPAFLAHANLPAWLESLALLQSKEYSNYTVISGRDGTVLQRSSRARPISSKTYIREWKSSLKKHKNRI
jgi:glyoxylase-like metal-dependent hydrolase (beta-lactamase superfamily II)